jgi:sugar-specific transcriptional regulator TrmB
MIRSKKVIADVRRIFDLNLYEARLWLAVLSRGISTAGDLSELSAVPRSRTYDVLASLVGKKLITRKIETMCPAKYIALPPHEILEQVNAEYVKKMEAQAEKIDGMKNEWLAKRGTKVLPTTLHSRKLWKDALERPKTPLKLFVWENVLTDYTEGLVCVLAHDEAEAWKLLKKKDELAVFILKRDGNKPKVVTKPEAFVVHGGG